MKIHHLGYLVRDLGKTVSVLSEVGYVPQGEIITDPHRGIHIQFMEKDGYRLELIMPVSEDSAYYSMLSTRRNMIYHICYESEDPVSDTAILVSLGFQQVEEATEAIGLGNRKGSFFFHPHVGVIEIVPAWEQVYQTIAEELDGTNHVSYESLHNRMEEEAWADLLVCLAKKKKKKIALLYGNCHTTVLSRFLLAAPAFRGEYYLVLMPPVFDMKKLKIDHIPPALLKEIDLFLYQNIGQDNIYGEQWASERLLQDVSERCVQVSFPNTMFYGYFPQESRRHDTIIKNQVNFVPMFCGDKYIDQNYAKTRSIKKTIEILRSDDLVSAQEVEKNLKKSFRMLELQDIGCSVMMRDYVVENFRRHYLFTEPKHPCDDFFREMAVRILRFLEMDDTLDQNACEERYTLSTINRLIYPAVRKHLQLEFPVEDYYIDRRLSKQRFSFEEYVEVYIRNTMEMD